MYFRLSSLFFLVSLLSACTGARINWDPSDYTVASGDSLHSIAWRFELDPDDLARWNKLSPPFIIRPGERLHTRPPAGGESKTTYAGAVTAPAATEVTVRPGDTLYSLARENNLSPARLATINGLRSPYVINPGQVLRLTGKPMARPIPAPITSVASGTTSDKAKAPVKAPVKTAAVSPVESNRNVSWQWPIEGKVIARFNKSKNHAKGIAIAGTEGQAVRASSAGKVVYSGNGLISYGNLIIIKHSRSYLSAYAHNKKLLVKEGETINAGQKIAELGKTGAEKP
ncbi:MAG: LysM peptidoglycan-binding domain-containing protein [Gammaproteobacteria bacterium]|jgi:lipoprotein NlpD|nr:LysM peptidoglycan-binding domain-containing protein [Gammaproteobacteria bacterium]